MIYILIIEMEELKKENPVRPKFIEGRTGFLYFIDTKI